MGLLKAHEQRLEMRYEIDTDNAFQSKVNIQSQKFKENGRKFKENSRNRGNQGKQVDNNSKNSRCGICKRKSHLEKDSWFKGKSQCQNCKKFGHEEKSCHLKQSHQANFSVEDDPEGSLFYASCKLFSTTRPRGIEQVSVDGDKETLTVVGKVDAVKLTKRGRLERQQRSSVLVHRNQIQNPNLQSLFLPTAIAQNVSLSPLPLTTMVVLLVPFCDRKSCN